MCISDRAELQASAAGRKIDAQNPTVRRRAEGAIVHHALITFETDTKMDLKLNGKQSEHVAVSLRTYGIGQKAAFGYAAVQVAHWFVGAVSFIALLLREVSALWFLKSAEHKNEQ